MPEPPSEDWIVELRRGASAESWDAFIAGHRRLIFSAIRHYARNYDDVMDGFARVCETLREDDLRRLRALTSARAARAAARA